MATSQRALHFPLLGRKDVQVDFSGGNLSSDAGVLLMAQLDQKIGLTERAAACIRDARLAERVEHPLVNLIRQRVLQIAAGYEDVNDAQVLRADPAFKVALGRSPVTDPHLASQPTLSRLEQTVGEEETAAINRLLVEYFLECPRKTPPLVILDFDPSEDPTHGQQEFAYYNGHYGGYCYLPLFGFARVVGEDDEFLVSAELPWTKGRDVDLVLETLDRLVGAIRERWPGVGIHFRGDAEYALPELYDWCEDHGVSYTIALPENRVLRELSAPWRERARIAAERDPGGRARRFGEFMYQAGTWRQERHVVVKAEHLPLGENPRYVVVSGVARKPRDTYRLYTGRGETENRIKELKGDIKSDRTSCAEFASNQFRLQLHALAYILYQRLRRLIRDTALAGSQVGTLRARLIKVAARITESTRRIHIALCSTCPTQQIWALAARRTGAGFQ